jgi:hypothetical protein
MEQKEAAAVAPPFPSVLILVSACILYERRGKETMNRAKGYRRLKFGPALFLLGVTTGCSVGQARYTPTSDEARTSLEKALTAWKDGKPVGEVEGTPPVRVVDSAWQAGQQIESFAIGDQEDVDGTKQFPVKLTIKKTQKSEDVRYIVHGRDPVWVYREEDYRRTLNMENGPVTAPKTRSAPGRTGRNR